MKPVVPLLLTLAVTANLVAAHGRLIMPPHRGYMYTQPGKDFFPPDYDDDGLSAGGIGSTASGKYGICGDPYDGVRAHETGGAYGLFPKYGAKAVGACYKPGQAVDIAVQITANHKGYFQFGLCKLNAKGDKETEECFQSLAQPNGEKLWQIPSGVRIFNMQYQLPAGVTCDGDSHCVLRWWYTGWNNADVGIWGQEHFWNCADIYISNSCPFTPSPAPTQDPNVTPSPGSDDNDNGPPLPSRSPTPTSSSTAVPPKTTPSPPRTTLSPPTPPPQTLSPSTVSPTPAPSNGDCGSCTNCYYAPGNSCFSGWTQSQCASVPAYKWCGL
ncbi:Aste57867_17202 [Aphanomyces stellatus]|uniref:Aste57867_17202 protein n=1 Tax=Aphanomyces stellatus TaxID=120398 RepID=A0A485L7I4_9STRA|nr:hypothetical protein As57867_017143 [Aphanomyces stellatus]VFT93959.1 Aste57867_17202 [Aphanomyces stellatus]